MPQAGLFARGIVQTRRSIPGARRRLQHGNQSVHRREQAWVFSFPDTVIADASEKTFSTICN